MNKLFDNLSDKFSEKLKGKNRTTILVVLGIVGMVFILLSNLFKPDEKKPASTIKNMSVNTNEYQKEIEEQLVNILQEINGVGKVKVMVTIEGSTEYVYAEEYNTKNDNTEDKTSQSYQNKYVIVDNGNTKEALVKKILKPKVSGVIVVCEGGNSPIISEKIYQAVSAVLDIPTNKICVAKG